MPDVKQPSVHLTLAERHQSGVALRQKLPRGDQAHYQTRKKRPDPVVILAAQESGRIADLLPERYRRMSQSAFSFYRGSAAIMAEDLSVLPATGIRVQSCGDAHLMNFGTFATPEGVPVFDINDFDETLAAPFEWDIKRLATSFILAGEGAGLKASECRALARSSAACYRHHVRHLAEMTPLDAWNNRIDLREAIGELSGKSKRHSAEKQLDQAMREGGSGYGLFEQGKDGSWRIPQKPPLLQKLPNRLLHVHAAFDRYAETLRAEQRVLFTRYEYRDVALKVVGIGSVGTLCAVALFTTADGAPLLLQLKQAQESVLVPFAGASPFSNQGHRVVTGQRIMQASSDPFLGWTDALVDGRQLYVRRLKDSRLASVGGQIQQDNLELTATLCGRTLARAHLRSGDGAVLRGYLGSGEAFEDAIAEFALAYAAQVNADYADFLHALQAGRLGPAARSGDKAPT